MLADAPPLFSGQRKAPPSNLAAEQATLGALLANNKAYERIRSFLTPEMFADPVNGKIYQSICRQIELGQIADAVTLKTEYENSGILREVGGTSYLTQLLTAMVGIINVADYGRTIHDCWIRRQEIEIAEQLMDDAYGLNPDVNGADALVRVEDEISALRDQAYASTAAKVGTVTVWDAFNEAIDRADSISRGDIARPYSTGLPAIDKVLGGGIAPDTFSAMVGDSGAGKTELALQIAEGVALSAFNAWVAGGQQGICPGVLYIMLGDMTSRQLGARTAARAAEMRLSRIRRGDIDMLEANRLAVASKTVLQMPLEISDEGPATIGRVLGDMRRVARRRPLALTIVDNFSDMLADESPEKFFGKALSTTRGLKVRGATAFNTSVLLLMHLNSNAASGKNRSPRPRPTDFPYNTKRAFDYGFGVFRPVKHLDPEPPPRPAAKLSAEGEEQYLKWKKQWEDKREPWPVGVADITEIVPMKAREEEDDGADKIGRLRFDRNRHRFVDVEEEEAAAAKKAGLDWMSVP